MLVLGTLLPSQERDANSPRAQTDQPEEGGNGHTCRGQCRAGGIDEYCAPDQGNDGGHRRARVRKRRQPSGQAR